jgi:hypothetical protein
MVHDYDKGEMGNTTKEPRAETCRLGEEIKKYFSE